MRFAKTKKIIRHELLTVKRQQSFLRAISNSRNRARKLRIFLRSCRTIDSTEKLCWLLFSLEEEKRIMKKQFFREIKQNKSQIHAFSFSLVYIFISSSFRRYNNIIYKTAIKPRV